MIVAKIDKDYLADRDEQSTSRVGIEWTKEQIESNFLPDTKLVIHPDTKTRFRMKDDDGEVYYGGWLINDDECMVQRVLLQWGAHDAGCTTIEVKNENDEWEAEIG